MIFWYKESFQRISGHQKVIDSRHERFNLVLGFFRSLWVCSRVLDEHHGFFGTYTFTQQVSRCGLQHVSRRMVHVSLYFVHLFIFRILNVYYNFRFDTMIQTALNGSSNVLVGRLIPTTPKPMRRMKRSEPKALQLFQILANGRICFAGRKLSFDLPSNPRKRQSMLDAINTFIDYLSHRRGLSLGHLRGF